MTPEKLRILEIMMDAVEFAEIRKKLNRTQKDMAVLLGISVKAVHSYEQGWRSIPDHVKRQMYFLLFGGGKDSPSCWTLLECPEELRLKCPAYEFDAGGMCWFVGGTACRGNDYISFDEKMKVCRCCDVLQDRL